MHIALSNIVDYQLDALSAFGMYQFIVNRLILLQLMGSLVGHLPSSSTTSLCPPTGRSTVWISA